MFCCFNLFITECTQITRFPLTFFLLLLKFCALPCIEEFIFCWKCCWINIHKITLPWFLRDWKICLRVPYLQWWIWELFDFLYQLVINKFTFVCGLVQRNSMFELISSATSCMLDQIAIFFSNILECYSTNCNNVNYVFHQFLTKLYTWQNPYWGLRMHVYYTGMTFNMEFFFLSNFPTPTIVLQCFFGRKYFLPNVHSHISAFPTLYLQSCEHFHLDQTTQCKILAIIDS